MKSSALRFQELLANISDIHAPLRARVVYALSEPSEELVHKLSAEWKNFPVERKRLLMCRLADATLTTLREDYSAVALIALGDSDPLVRCAAVDTLVADERPDYLEQLISLLETDDEPDVRAAAARGLGSYVELSELGNLPLTSKTRAEDALLKACAQFEPRSNIHQRALESIAYSERAEVSRLIEQAYRDATVEVKATALFAMGRTGSRDWSPLILHALGSAEPALVFQATKAAGDLGLVKALPILLTLIDKPDMELKEAAVWALGEIGGREAYAALTELLKHESDESIMETIEDAISTASLAAENLELVFPLWT